MSNPQPPTTLPEINDPAAGQSDKLVPVPLDDNRPARKSKPAASDDGRGGLRGCLMGLGGTMGCLLLVVLLLGGATLATGATLRGMFDGVLGDIASFWQNSGFDPIPEDVYIPPVEPIQQLAQLSTVRYNYAETLAAETNMPDLLSRLYGNSLVLVAVGSIRAGVDLNTMTDDDIIYDDAENVLTLRLPAPQLQECFLNDSETYVAERLSAVFAPDAPQLDTESRRFAVRDFRDRALEDGILQDAALETETVVREFVQALVDEVEVRVISAAIDPDAPLPDSCQ